MLTLLGVAVVIVGFAVRVNPLLVVVAAALVTGLFAGMSLHDVIAALGKGFNDSRQVTIALLAYPVVGLAERAGLQERARTLIARFRRVSVGPFLIGYLAFRQLTAAIGLLAIAGQAPTVRPLVAPMAEEAAEARAGPLEPKTRHAIRAMAAATDNVGAFFGEDIFLAFGSILLMVSLLAHTGIVVDPLKMSLWAIPTAIAAFFIHGARLLLFERGLKRRAEPRP